LRLLDLRLLDLRLLDLLEDFRVDFFAPRLRGTFAPFDRASDSPIAIACLRLFTFRPLPLLRVPFLRRRIALPTRFDADFPYLRVLFFLPDELRFRAAIRRSVVRVRGGK
jgi:hypothetical protein